MKVLSGIAGDVLPWLMVLRGSLWLWLRLERTRTAVMIERESRRAITHGARDRPAGMSSAMILRGTPRAHDDEVLAKPDQLAAAAP